MRSFDYEHTVSLDESNVFGNVYFSHYLRWQGLCRERFLHECAPDVLSPESDVVLATVHASCDYLREALSGRPALRIPKPEADAHHAYYKFYAFVRPKALEAGWDRDRIMNAVSKAGIPCYSALPGDHDGVLVRSSR